MQKILKREELRVFLTQTKTWTMTATLNPTSGIAWFPRSKAKTHLRSPIHRKLPLVKSKTLKSVVRCFSRPSTRQQTRRKIRIRTPLQRPSNRARCGWALRTWKKTVSIDLLPAEGSRVLAQVKASWRVTLWCPTSPVWHPTQVTSWSTAMCHRRFKCWRKNSCRCTVDSQVVEYAKRMIPLTSHRSQKSKELPKTEILRCWERAKWVPWCQRRKPKTN